MRMVSAAMLVGIVMVGAARAVANPGVSLEVTPIAESVPIGLAWDANPEPDIAGYRVYHGLASRNYGRPQEAGNSTTALVDGLSPDTTYFFAVTAFNTAGLESLPSDEISVLTTAPATPSPVDTFELAAVVDPDSGVVRVAFLVDGSVLADLTDEPFVFNWQNVAPGTYSLSARAIDAAGGSTESAAVTVTVGDPHPALRALEALPDRRIQLTIAGAAGQTVRVEVSPNHHDWNHLAEASIATGILHVIDPEPIVTGGPPRFYRVVEE